MMEWTELADLLHYAGWAIVVVYGVISVAVVWTIAMNDGGVE